LRLFNKAAMAFPASQKIKMLLEPTSQSDCKCDCWYVGIKPYLKRIIEKCNLVKINPQMKGRNAMAVARPAPDKWSPVLVEK